MVKYLHIFPDEKSVDYVIENCEKLTPGEHIYALRNATIPLKFVKSSLALTYSLEGLLELATNQEIQHIYLHFLKEDALDFVLKYKGKAKLTWVFWGADGYILPRLEAISTLPKSKQIDDKARNPFYFLGLKKLLLNIKSKRDVNKLTKALKKISYCATWVSGDIALIKPYAEHIKPIHFSNYSIHQLIDTRLELDIVQDNFILLGNSGYAPNNHIEGVEYLKSKGWNGRVLMPMAYGNKKYIQATKQAIEDIIPALETLESFLDKAAYHKLLSTAKVVFLNHTRQQAAGNALAALWYGIPIIMNAKSSLAQTFKAWGLTFYLDIEVDSISSITALSDETIQRNRRILDEKMGETALKDMYRNLLFITH